MGDMGYGRERQEMEFALRMVKWVLMIHVSSRIRVPWRRVHSNYFQTNPQKKIKNASDDIPNIFIA